MLLRLMNHDEHLSFPAHFRRHLKIALGPSSLLKLYPFLYYVSVLMFSGYFFVNFELPVGGSGTTLIKENIQVATQCLKYKQVFWPLRLVELSQPSRGSPIPW